MPPSVATTFPTHQRRCGWNALLAPRAPTPPLRGRVDCALAVIGAGYTGLAAARTFAESRPDSPVVLLDADVLGEGSPGRNSGFMLEIALADDADAGAVARMAAVNRRTRETMDWLRALAAQSGADCDLVRAGTYRGAATVGGMAGLDHYRAFLEAAGLEHRVLDREAMAARIGTRHYLGGLWSPDCSLVQPAALVRALASVLPEGVALHERSPALALWRIAGGWCVTTPDGEVRAERVVLANNAFAASLGYGGARLVPIYTYAGLTPRLDGADLAALGDDPCWGLLPAHRLGTTLRRTVDGRLLVRSFYGYRREADNGAVEVALQGCMARRYPVLAGVGLEHVWGGTTGLTRNGAPVWGESAPGLWVSAGCNGGGVVKGSLLGRALVQTMLGGPADDVRTLFGTATWMPPEPLRALGFELLTRRWRREAGAEV
ncbi:MAG: FAD-binding oxidoreductase [Ectothiorhodospiraceae bacterium]|nr:FAD-binding oxidoreductase [Ectothiorhodospiraceae bacterium]